MHDIPQCSELMILGVTFQDNCKFTSHVRVRLVKANKCLHVVRTLTKEVYHQFFTDECEALRTKFSNLRYPSKFIDTVNKVITSRVADNVQSNTMDKSSDSLPFLPSLTRNYGEHKETITVSVLKSELLCNLFSVL